MASPANVYILKKPTTNNSESEVECIREVCVCVCHMQAAAAAGTPAPFLYYPEGFQLFKYPRRVSNLRLLKLPHCGGGEGC